MRILLITDNYNIDAGGAEKHFFYLKDLLEKDNDVYTLGFDRGSFEDKKTKIIRCPENKFFRYLSRVFFYPTIYFEIKKYINKIKPDVIHIHNINKYTISTLFAIKGYPIVNTVHDYNLLCPTATNLHNDLSACENGIGLKCLMRHKGDENVFTYLVMLISFFLKTSLTKLCIKCFIAPSPRLQRLLKNNGFRNVYLVNNFIMQNKKKPKILKNNKKILYVGKLEKNKGIIELLESMIDVIKVIPNTKLSILGKGSIEKKLKGFVTKNNMQNNIEFCGWINKTDKYYENSNLVVVPSLTEESFCFVIIEAMMHGRPVIGSDRGSIPWLIDDKKTGMIFNPVNKKDLQTKILQILSDYKKARMYGTNGYKKITKFPNNNELLNRLISVYNKAIE